MTSALESYAPDQPGALAVPGLANSLYNEDGTPVGLEEFYASASLPRIKVMHKRGTFALEDGSEGQVLIGVALGIIRKRVLFQAKMEPEGTPARCRSNDSKIGFPTLKAEKDKWAFKLEESGGRSFQYSDELGVSRTAVDCETCAFSQWVDDDPPQCKLMMRVPMVFTLLDSMASLQDGLAPAVEDFIFSGILSVKTSWLKPWNAYFGAYKRTNRPLLTGITQVTLSPAKRGDNEYCTPVIRRVGVVPDEHQLNFAQQFREVAVRLRKPPRDPDTIAAHDAAKAAAIDGEVVDPWGDMPDTTPQGPPATAQAAPAAQPAAAPAPQAARPTAAFRPQTTAAPASPAANPSVAQAGPSVKPAAGFATDDEDIPF